VVETAGRRATRGALATLIFGAALAAVLGLGASSYWFFDLFTNFRPEIAVTAGLAGIAAALFRFRILALTGAATCALTLGLMAPVVWPRPQLAVADARAVRVVSFNIAYFNRDFSRIGPYVESLQADVAVLQELPLRDMAGVLAQLPSYPHHFVEANSGPYGVVVVSRWPLRDPQVLSLAVRGRNSARLTVEFPDARLTFYAVHLWWPLTLPEADDRNTQLHALAAELAGCPGNCLVVGDFNTTRWSPHFQDLLRDSGLRDCAEGVFVPGTWPSWGLPLRLRIDHCLRNEHVEVTRVVAGGAVGSDHLSTINDLRIARSAN